MASDNNPDQPRGPSLREGLRGSAHIYDLLRQFSTGRDPRVREMVDDLDEVSIGDLLARSDQLTAAAAGTPTPHYDVVDTHYGAQIVIDTQDTPVDPARLAAYVTEDGQARVVDPETNWHIAVSPDGEDTQIEDVDAPTTQSSIARIPLRYADAGLAASVDDATRQDTPAPADHSLEELFDTTTSDDAPADGSGPTLDEALEEHAWFREFVEAVVDERTLSWARSVFGDVPITELPFDMADPGTVTDAMDSAESDAFEYPADVDDTDATDDGNGEGDGGGDGEAGEGADGA